MADHCLFEARASIELVGVILGASERVLDEVVGEGGLSCLSLAEESEAVLNFIHEAEVSHLQLRKEGVHFFPLLLAALHPLLWLSLLGTVSWSLHL